MPGPIKPSEVQKKKDDTLPEEVFIVFNDLITKEWDGHSARVLQKKAATGIALALGITIGEVYKRKLCDVESSYRKAGWKVDYDKPGFNETYEATFTFTKK